MTRIVDRLPAWLRASIATAVFTFVGTTGVALAGWLTEVANWARSDGAVFPSFSVVTAAAISAAAGAGGFVVNAFVRWAQQRAESSTGRVGRFVARHSNPPVYPSRVGTEPLRRAETLRGG